MNNWSQETRSIGIETPLGKDVLILLDIKGKEAISELTSMEIELASERVDITPKEVIGKLVDIWIKLEDGSKRFFNGYINRFALGPMKSKEHRAYRAEVVPWLWFHDQNSDCRIFQNKTVLQVIETLFGESKIANFHFNCQKQYPKLNYCVQYRESDMDFLSRLAELHGLFFFFTQEQGQHSLVIADQATAYPNCIEHSVTQTLGGHLGDHITTWNHQYEYITSQWSQTDFDFESPSTNLETTSKTVLDLSETTQIEHFEYPGGYGTLKDGQALTDIHMMEDEENYDVVHARSTYRGFFAGGKFSIAAHDFNQEVGKSYVITGLSFRAKERSYFVGSTGKNSYFNEFSTVPSTVPYYRNTQKPKPMVYGPQTAMVVGPNGEKIYTDQYGRVKIKFHWDHHGADDESCSCWVRVSQNWAGKQWGEMSVPHVGNEVIVSFLEGDPDKPIVTGRVYNAESMPPQQLPINKQKRIIRDDGGNEIVMNATQGQQQIRIESPGSAALVMGHNVTDLKGPKGDTGAAGARGRKGDKGETGAAGQDAEESYEGEIAKENWNVFGYQVGDKFEAGLGSNYEFSGGADFEFRVGAKAEIYVGADLEAKAAMSTTLHFGTQHEYSLGAKFERHHGPVEEFSEGPQVNETEEDILSRAARDHIVAAGDALCMVANCEDKHGESRSLIGAKGNEISLSIGKDYIAPATLGHNTWYKKPGATKTGISKATRQKYLFGAATVSAIVAHLAITIAALVGGLLNKEQAGAKVGLMTGGGVVAGSGLAIMTVLNIISYFVSKEANKDSAIEPITREVGGDKEPDAKINITTGDGIEIRAKEKPVKLVSGAPSDQNAAILELTDKLAQLCFNKSEIWVKKSTGTITLDTSSTAGSSGKIQLFAKDDILLESTKEVKIKSKTFSSKNFKVLGT